MSLDDFWRMTPWQLEICLEGFIEAQEQEHNSRIWHGWHQAAFSRAKSLPKLKDLLHKKQDIEKIPQGDIMARMKARQKELNGGKL